MTTRTHDHDPRYCRECSEKYGTDYYGTNIQDTVEVMLDDALIPIRVKVILDAKPYEQYHNGFVIPIDRYLVESVNSHRTYLVRKDQIL